jgi:aminotransferase
MQHHLTPRCHFEPPALRLITERIRKRPDGINLSQGTCQLPVPEVAINANCEAIHNGFNAYSSADGIPALRANLTKKLNTFNRIVCDETQVLVTSGSTGAFESLCNAYLSPGDEVAIFSPAYPYHVDKLIERGVTIKRIHLDAPEWNFDPDQMYKCISPGTKFVLLCNPSNPTGKVFTESELTEIANRCIETDTLCVTDEVYEYITFDDRRHVSMASIPAMSDRTFTMGSYSKTFAITGWRIGYICCPKNLYAPVRSMWDHQAVCANVPAQHAVATAIEQLGDDYYLERRIDYHRKREILFDALAAANLEPCRPQGAYYIVAQTSQRFPHLTSEQVADTLVDDLGVGCVPASDFLGREVLGKPRSSNILRFNFAVADNLLEIAADRLRAW